MKSIRTIIVLFCGLLCSLSLPAQLDSLILIDTQENEIRLEQYADSTVLVLIFTSNHCVYSKKYEDRLLEMIAEYQKKGVAFLLINANSPAMSSEDRLELMAQRAEERAYPCPYVQDPDAQMARTLGATKNPEVFVGKWKDNTLSVLYSGKIDDNPLMYKRVENHYLRDALDQILAGKSTPIESVPPIGCGIKMKK
jgi:thiol-disulfide isomerase/thioredoxin